MVNHLRLRNSVKIDKNVTAQDQIHAFHEKHFGVVLQIDPAEGDQLLHRRKHLQFFLIDD